MNYFETYEYVPPHIYQEKKDKAIEAIDYRIPKIANMLRKRYGPAIINDWWWGGTSWSGSSVRKWSGLRTCGSVFYRVLSQHTFGRAIDMLFRDVSIEEIRNDIILIPRAFPDIHAIEMGVDWLHVDCRNCTKFLQFWS